MNGRAGHFPRHLSCPRERQASRYLKTTSNVEVPGAPVDRTFGEIGMHEYEQHTVIGAIAIAVIRVVSWAAAGALLGLAGGALFGILFGVLYGLTHGGPGAIVPIAAYLAVCGAAAGALTGAVGA